MLRPAEELFAGTATRNAPLVLLMDRTMHEHLADLGRLPSHVVIVAMDAETEAALRDEADLSLAGLHDARARERIVQAACEVASARLAAARKDWQLGRMRGELAEIHRIGMALMLERNQDVLLHRIVEQGKRLTESDAGLLLLLESNESGVQCLRAGLYEFDSLPGLPPLGEELPIDNTSIIGHACVIRKPVVIDDAYDLPPDAAFRRNPDFDQRYGYRIRSMLIVPMIDHRDDLVGVLVFINRKSDPSATIRSKEEADRYVLRYARRQVRLARSLAGHAAVSIENAKLHAQIEHILECFVKAAVSAVDQRDPTTAGHSLRVAALTTDLAAAVERVGRGRYRDVHFTREQIRELHFAALLHDFGKVAVREEVLIKAKKLPARLTDRVEARFDLIRRTLEVEYCRKRADLLRAGADKRSVAALEAEFIHQLAQLDRMRLAVRIANEPSVCPEPPRVDLPAIAKHTFRQPDGAISPYLTAEELHYLSIPQGTLDARERSEIESHVDQTHRFLMAIPWTDDLKNLASYAYAHHEKLDGTGYPRHIRGDDIPIQARIMTIADIFDALTESDRPYKRAVSVENALDIIRAEAGAGQLDAELVDILVDSQVYRRILEEDWRRF
jgi:HD-GYP domain-containing protein (c-di-GMP phosphodiesterase class II)